MYLVNKFELCYSNLPSCRYTVDTYIFIWPLPESNPVSFFDEKEASATAGVSIFQKIGERGAQDRAPLREAGEAVVRQVPMHQDRRRQLPQGGDGQVQVRHHQRLSLAYNTVPTICVGR